MINSIIICILPTHYIIITPYYPTLPHSTTTDIGAPSVMDDFRTLQFNLSSLSTADDIIAIDLVVKQLANVPAYKTQLHEVIAGESEDAGTDLKLVHEGEHEGGAWHTIHVQNVVDSRDLFSGDRNYQLVLSLSSEQELPVGDVLHSIKPMLLVYTNDANVTTPDSGTGPGTATPTQGRSTPGSSRTKGARDDTSIRRRRRRREATVTPQSASLPTLDSLGAQHCRKEVRTMSFQDLGWPGSDYEVVSPEVATFSFCYGLCDKANDYSHLGTPYTSHARVLSMMKPELVANRIAPGCAALDYKPTEVSYYSPITRVVTVTTMPDVTSCLCM